MIIDTIKTDTGSIIVSIVLGLGLAAMLRGACTGRSCMVVKAPPLKETSDYVYKIDGDCYKYKPKMTKCPE